MLTDRPGASRRSSEIFLGVAFTSGLEEVVIPFFDRGLPVEYELTRSIRVVSRSGRKKVGILNTDAKLMGGFDMRSLGQNPEWSIVTELKKQYEVSSVAPDAPIATDLDVLLVAQPSSLTQKQIDNLTDVRQEGGPDAPLPRPASRWTTRRSRPRCPSSRPAARSAAAPRPSPRATSGPCSTCVGLDWPSTEIVWNAYNPHPQLADLPPEIVFIGRGSGAEDAFNSEQIATSGFRRSSCSSPACSAPSGRSGPEFTPLLRTSDDGRHARLDRGRAAGLHGHLGINPSRRHIPTGISYTLAARLTGPAAGRTADKDDADEEGRRQEGRGQEGREAGRPSR